MLPSAGLLSSGNPLLDDVHGVYGVKLLEDKVESVLELGADFSFIVLRHVPYLFLERAEGLFPRLVDELLVRLAFFFLGRALGSQVRVHLLFERSRKSLALINKILETGREMHLCRALFHEYVERVVRQSACPVLHNAREAVILPRHGGEFLYCVEIHLNLGYRAVRQRNPSVARACLYAQLAYALYLAAEYTEVSVHECP